MWNKGLYKEKKGENTEKGQKIQEKENIILTLRLVSQQGNVGPSMRGAGGLKR